MPLIDTSSMTRPEKVALMESLWSDISDDSNHPPSWHRAELESRETEWAERETLSQDWQEAKDDLRNTLSK